MSDEHPCAVDEENRIKFFGAPNNDLCKRNDEKILVISKMDGWVELIKQCGIVDLDIVHTMDISVLGAEKEIENYNIIIINGEDFADKYDVVRSAINNNRRVRYCWVDRINDIYHAENITSDGHGIHVLHDSSFVMTIRDVIYKSIFEGRKIFCETHMRKIIGEKLSALTPTERKIFDDVMQGKSNKEIAYYSGRSLNTIKVHRANINMKIGHTSTIKWAIVLARYGNDDGGGSR